jgi:hypothetical protein
MAYTVKLKNQAGIDVNYSDVETVTIPFASGSGNAVFSARYGVTKNAAARIAYNGGDHAANGVDYICVISTNVEGYKVPDSTGITVKIGGKDATVNLAWTYSKLSDTIAVVKVVGQYITGDIALTAVAVS